MSTLSIHSAANPVRNSNTFITTAPSSVASSLTRPEVKSHRSITEFSSSINAHINSFCSTPSPLPLCNWRFFIQFHVSKLEPEEMEAKTALTTIQRNRIHMFIMKEFTSMRSFLPRIELAKRDIKDPYPFPYSLTPNPSYFNYLPLRRKFHEMRKEQENEILGHMTNGIWNSRIPPEQFHSVFWYHRLNSELNTNGDQLTQPSCWFTFINKIEDNLIAASKNPLDTSNAFRDTVDRLHSPAYTDPRSRNHNLQLPKPNELLCLFLDREELANCLSDDDLRYALLHIFDAELITIQKDLIYSKAQPVWALVEKLFNRLKPISNLQLFKKQLQEFMKTKVQEFEQYTEKSQIDHFRLQSRFVYDMIKANLPEFAFPDDFLDWLEADPKCCCIIQ